MTLIELATANAFTEFPTPTGPTPTPMAVAAPHDCCRDFAYVIFCGGETDTWKCELCGTAWTAPCRN